MEYKFNIDEIKQQIKEVIQYSQNLNTELNGIDSIIEHWLQAKNFFIEHMNGKLIYEHPEPVSFELDKSAKETKFTHFIEHIEDRYEYDDLVNFLYSITAEDFYNNKTVDKYVYNGIVIPPNYKIIKAFKFFVEDETILKDFQNEASRIIQENCVNGTLCFSVHPLDFLSASENIHNWRSCHSLDGDYRSGNLNYLMDKSTVICYLRADKNAILPNFPESVPWNSKKWRVWLFFSNDMTMLFAGRQYPFASLEGLNLIKDEILPVLSLDEWTKFSKDKISHYTDSFSGTYFYLSNLVPVGRELIPMKKLVRDGMDTFHYNDLLRSTCYDPLYAYRYSTVPSCWWDSNYHEPTGMSTPNTKFLIGEACPCPVCGRYDIEHADAMVCGSCYDGYDEDDYGVCDICGNHVYYEDLICLHDDIYICQDCYLHQTYQCQICGEVDLPEYVRQREGDPRRLCEHCYEEVMSEPLILSLKETEE